MKLASPRRSCDEEANGASCHISRAFRSPTELAPFLALPCGSAQRLPGFHRAVSLHPSGCKRLCLGGQNSERPAGSHSRPGAPFPRRPRGALSHHLRWRQLRVYGPHAPAAVIPGRVIGTVTGGNGPPIPAPSGSSVTVAALSAVQTVFRRVVRLAIVWFAVSSADCCARPAIAALISALTSAALRKPVRSVSLAYCVRSGSWLSKANLLKS